jgi:transcriptional regulator with XRE-family HTH domain
MKVHDVMADRYRANTRKLREKRGLSQAALAKIMGVSDQYFQQLETGGRNPSRNMIEKTANALGVDPSALMKGTR